MFLSESRDVWRQQRDSPYLEKTNLTVGPLSVCTKGTVSRTPRQEKMAQKNYDPQHPLIAAGFIPEAQVRELWEYSDEYWPKWLRTNHVPGRVIGGVRWFHRDQLVNWFCSVPVATEDEQQE